MSGPNRYMPLFTPGGEWIARPDLYLLARMGCPDSETEAGVLQIYDAMCGSDYTTSELSSLDRSIRERHVTRDLRFRVMAGEVVLEMVRIAATTSKSPSLGRAARLAAFNRYAKFPKSSLESLEGSYLRAFSQYRNTAHLQATFVETRSDLEFEGSLENVIVFLSRARAFEGFIDIHLTQKSFRWSPWRVPTCIPMLSEFAAPRLSEEEIAVIGKA